MSSRHVVDNAEPAGSVVRQWMHQIWSYAKELYLYAAVGGLVLGLDVCSFWLLLKFGQFHYLAAHLVSRSLGGLCCFVLNRFVTFRKKSMDGVVADFIKFLMLYAASFLLSSGLIHFGIQVCHLPEVGAKITAECMVFIFNYTIMKYWVMAKGGGKA